MNIVKKDGKIVFEFPESLPRYNPYMSDEEQKLLGCYPCFTGLIVHHTKNGNDYVEMGFANTIDQDYKGKDDGVGDFIVRWLGDEIDFLEKCKELNLSVLDIVD